MLQENLGTYFPAIAATFCNIFPGPCHHSNFSVADLRGARGTCARPRVQILSISCSFWKIWQNCMLGSPPPQNWHPLPWGNPLSATAKLSHLSNCGMSVNTLEQACSWASRLCLWQLKCTLLKHLCNLPVVLTFLLKYLTADNNKYKCLTGLVFISDQK